jgi:NAD(P)-dependent dehydrogenase (short-subunit alcohol dehydrogenase family)
VDGVNYLEEVFSLDGRHAVVTGGSSGIGRAIAGALARAGASVTLVARDEQRLRAAAEPLAARWFAADLADRAAIADLAAHADPADILVNAAGVNLRPPLAELSTVDWDRTLQVNLTAPFLLGQAFAPHMVRQGWGRIINLASQQAIRAFGNSGAYGVSKAGIAALTRSQAEAWSPAGVCCNAIAPGFVRTPLTKAVFDESPRADAMARRTMVGRNGELADLTGVAIFLAGNAAAYLTGQTIFVDGGFSAT